MIIDSRRGDPDGPKDANDALIQGLDLCDLMAKSTWSPNDKNLITLNDLSLDILDRLINVDKYAGIKSRTMHFVNKTMKGLRPGEFTLVTGATGSGKTTFLSQLSLDFIA